MFGVIGIPLKKTLGLNATEFGLLTATPVLTGSLIRVPLGIWTDKYGGRIVMTRLMAVSVPAIWLMACATACWHFLAIGLFVSLAGGSFSVGTPCVARWFPKSRQGMAMGVYGAGNSGSAVNKFAAPALLLIGGWTLVPQVYAAVMLGTVILFWFCSASDPRHLVPSNTRFVDQLKMLRDPNAAGVRAPDRPVHPPSGARSQAAAGRRRAGAGAASLAEGTVQHAQTRPSARGVGRGAAGAALARGSAVRRPRLRRRRRRRSRIPARPAPHTCPASTASTRWPACARPRRAPVC